jgi:type II secretory pathway pseudopilin PulG
MLAMKIQRYHWVTIAALAILLLIAVVLNFSPVYDRHRDRDGEARVVISSFRNATLVYIMRSGHTPLVTEPGPDRPVDFLKLRMLLASTNNALGYALISSNAIERTDPWGRVYRVWIDANGDGRVELSHAIVRESVAVWSVGRNGLNEMGRGDDIPSW